MSAYSTYSDEQLLAALKNDDQSAFKEIYDRYWKRLLYHAARKIEDVTLAEEAVQDVLLSLWNRRHDLHSIIKLDVYLATACTYLVIKYRRKREREFEIRQLALQNIAAAQNAAEEDLTLADLEKQITSLVGSLPEQTQLVYRMSRENGYSYKLIGQKLHISPKTVDYHIVKALKQLRAALSNFLFTLLM